MMRSADQTYVLADSTKFGHVCLATFANLSEIHLTITDRGTPAQFVRRSESEVSNVRSRV